MEYEQCEEHNVKRVVYWNICQIFQGALFKNHSSYFSGPIPLIL